MTQKNKNILLVAGLVFTLIIVYKLAISETLKVKDELNVIEARMGNLENLPQTMANLNQKEVFLDSILTSNNIKGTSVQNSLLNILNDDTTTERFKIIEFNEPISANVDGATIVSYSFGLEGGFQDMVNVIYTLEQNNSVGKIKHLEFLKGRDFRRRKNYLECRVILENLISE